MTHRTPDKDRIIELAKKWQEGNISEDEKLEFDQWYDAFNDTQMPELTGLTPDQLKEKMYAAITEEAKTTRRTGVMVWLTRRSVVAAAAVLLLLLSLTWLYTRPSRPSPVAANDQRIADTAIVPGSNKAVLTLANGSRMILDSAKNGLLAMQGGTGVVKKDDGAISYQQGNTSSAIGVNTVSTPRGGQYAVTLPDGSRVWLNAASSIRFPTAFTGNERLVQISGEAYMEVAQDKARPFRVDVVYPSGGKAAGNPGGNGSSDSPSGGKIMEIEVLGTQFNIMAYAEEKVIKTTLLEGAVRVVKGNASKVLRPGQQAQLKEDSLFHLLNDANTEEAVAWKNGQTLFAGEDIPAIMRKVSRWYDVDVEYQGQLSGRNFTGGISRKADISELLKILELNHIHFSVKGKKIILMP